MKVIFLDYDGVVNTLIWDKDTHFCGFNYPYDGKVNNYQAIMWLNKLCIETGAKIVVSSTWRYCCKETSYQDCLYNAELDKRIEIIGCTDFDGSYKKRYDEIKEYLDSHNDIENYVILDDEPITDEHHFVKCNPNFGFGISEYSKAKAILENK